MIDFNKSDKTILFYDKDNNRYLFPVTSDADPDCYRCLILDIDETNAKIKDSIILNKNEFSKMETIKCRLYQLRDPLHPYGGPTVIFMNEQPCVFCHHCTDIYWDYTHGIYSIKCELHDILTNGCEDFDET